MPASCTLASWDCGQWGHISQTISSKFVAGLVVTLAEVHIYMYNAHLVMHVSQSCMLIFFSSTIHVQTFLMTNWYMIYNIQCACWVNYCDSNRHVCPNTLYVDVENICITQWYIPCYHNSFFQHIGNSLHICKHLIKWIAFQ